MAAPLPPPAPPSAPPPASPPPPPPPARPPAPARPPGVCPIHGVGPDAGVPYIVMGFVPGRPLSDGVAGRGKPFAPRQAAGIVRKLALAIDAAHQKGVIHRDLKPANVM